VSTIFWVCAFAGGGFILLQSLMGLMGLDDHGHDAGDHGSAHAGDGLNLLSLRSIAAGFTFFGLTGLAALEWGFPRLLAVPLASVAGLGVALGVAMVMRGMHRMESDGVVRVEGAVGHPATVYLSIPGGEDAPGKVHLFLQGRTVEYKAVSRDPLPTGAAVVVVDVVGPDTLEVAPQPLIGAADAS
jgi:membrane protein implicated in regulation of membrane protease activity